MNGAKTGVYIHIPFCKSKCNYCAFVSCTDFSLQRSYVKALIGEIKNSYGRGEKTDTVYIGGGTPSCLFRGGIEQILDAVTDTFCVDKNAEITVECNPESVTSDFAEECAINGVNRLSMGLQSSDDGVLRRVGRAHDLGKFISAIKILGNKFDNISSDLILGLPGQTFDDISHAVDIFDEYCTHASVYALTVEEGTPLFKSGYSPEDDAVADMYDFSVKKLCECGFKRYEVSNFARNGRVSRHNLKYWNSEPYFGFGVAAHGYDGNVTRYAHGNGIAEYISDPMPTRTILTEKDKYNEYVMLSLRTENGIKAVDFKSRFGFDFAERNIKTLADLARRGYIEITEEHIRIAPEYMFVMNGIIEDLMID